MIKYYVSIKLIRFVGIPLVVGKIWNYYLDFCDICLNRIFVRYARIVVFLNFNAAVNFDEIWISGVRCRKVVVVD